MLPTRRPSRPDLRSTHARPRRCSHARTYWVHAMHTLHGTLARVVVALNQQRHLQRLATTLQESFQRYHLSTLAATHTHTHTHTHTMRTHNAHTPRTVARRRMLDRSGLNTRKWCEKKNLAEHKSKATYSACHHAKQTSQFAPIPRTSATPHPRLHLCSAFLMTNDFAGSCFVLQFVKPTYN